ncbi:MAG: hypothetical protein Alpg2KO_13260 [Alphaproteobacteria bacterium]
MRGDREHPMIAEMIETGYTGRKGKGGFYRLNRDGGKKVKEAKSLQTGDYAPANRKVQMKSISAGRKGIGAVIATDDKGGAYAKATLLDVLSYSAALVPEIADTILGVDDAMKWGYAWKKGPFEMIDDIGADVFAGLLKEAGRDVPPLLQKAVEAGSFYKIEDGTRYYLDTDGKWQQIERPDSVLLLSDIKLKSEPVEKNGSACLWDIGDGVLCLEFTSKMNSIDEGIMKMIGKAIQHCSKGDPYKALVVYNEGSNFSVGANLGVALFALNIALYPQIEQSVAGGQATYKALKHAPFPVVGAPSGMALGGGCEILLHCDSVQAHAESYIGLVEVGVGLIPGWGGCKEMVQRHITNKKRAGGAMPALQRAFQTIGMAEVAKSADEAKSALFLRAEDGITMNRDRLLADAKAKALSMVEGYTSPEPIEVNLPGESAQLLFDQAVSGFHASGKATAHDVTVSAALSAVLTGDGTDITETLTEDDLLKLEVKHFMNLVRTEGTVARIEHMLETGRPLRN